MNKDIFFVMHIKDADGALRGMAVRISPEKETLPGDRIKTMTEAARSLSLAEHERLRTEMLVEPPPGVPIRALSDYLWADGSTNTARLVRHLESYRQGRSPHLFQPRVGITVVMDEEFIGREKPLADLEVNISAKRSCHLRAPRRYGKSSLLGRVAALRPQAVLLELSDIGTLPGFLKALVSRCMRNQAARACLHELPVYRPWPAVTDAASMSQVFNAAFAEIMASHGNDPGPLLRETMTALAGAGIVLLIDEFSLFLRDMLEKNVADLTSFLEIFHRLRTRTGNPLTAVFAGSAGLSTYIELLGMHALFADLVPVDIPPVTQGEAKLLAEELFYGMEKAPFPAAIDRLVELTGNDETVPYFVHALAHYTTEQVGQKREIGVADVETAYYDRLLGPLGNICFRDFILRERAYPEEYRSCASPILKALSRLAPVPVPEAELKYLCEDRVVFDKLMICLEEDYDLVRQGDTWRMRSRVIADRWRLGEPWLTLGGR
ncbi:MAG: hypothetical protein LLG97_18565 [Deltaproteobacteria bacterium]|nr:hypothetical protein [Deltaproteobacteria bacterium]